MRVVDRRRFPLKLVIAGLLLQLTLAVLFLKVPLLQDLLLVINKIVLTLEAATGDTQSIHLLYTVEKP